MPEPEKTLQRRDLRVTLFGPVINEDYNLDGSLEREWRRFRVRAHRRDRSPRVERYFEAGLDTNWSRTYTCTYSETDMGEINTLWILAEGWHNNIDDVPTGKRLQIVGVQHPFYRGEDNYVVVGVE